MMTVTAMETDMTDGTVHIDRGDDGIAVLRLDRPPVNAMNRRSFSRNSLICSLFSGGEHELHVLLPSPETLPYQTAFFILLPILHKQF